MWFYNEVDTQYALVKGEGIILLYQPQPQVTKCDPTGRKYNFCISLSDGYGDRSLRPGPPISILADRPFFVLRPILLLILALRLRLPFAADLPRTHKLADFPPVLQYVNDLDA